jgi:hypothetical protein
MLGLLRATLWFARALHCADRLAIIVDERARAAGAEPAAARPVRGRSTITLLMSLRMGRAV